ncbi:Mini-ribonuclease 3 [Tumebacillus sp. ITR2]|uniref:Mini-ribonuclease 3 n=1 Tax=Tumebacillus amylolyticus TaxID=2801339 RepID=A0ABS1JGR8_9BACL|nr:Mini-ribonuclease 3 [Tumebacillus amylolyticus]MBL0389427.1 Mini-ribonuclease 3 [Tumebacillus amylolyticus]
MNTESENAAVRGLTPITPLVKKPQEMPGLPLAYMGDAVWEMFIRQHLLCKGEMQPNRLHKYATRYVKAKSQADVLHFLSDSLSEEEMNVVKRGRNAKSGSTPKNGDLIDYRYATGFESLLGYLYLQARYDRLQELATHAIQWLESQDN